MINGLQPYAEYKNPRLPWLEAIPEHWEMIPNRALMKGQREIVGERASDYTLLSLTLQGVIERDMVNPRGKFPAQFNTYKVVRPNDLIFCLFDIDETPRGVGLSNRSGMITGAYDVYTPTSRVDPRFLYHYYRFVDDRKLMKPLYTGLRKTIQPGIFASLKTPCPPPDEQKAIVRFLEYADRRIRRYIRGKQKLIKLLEEHRRAIVHHAVTRGLDTRVRVRPSGIDWIGDVPEHWEIWQIRHFAAVGNGSTPSRSNAAYWSGGAFPWLNSGSVNAGIITSSDQFVTDTALRECHLPRVSAGSVLVAITGQGKTRGTAAVLAIEATINQHIAFIAPRRQKRTATPDYLRLFLVAAYPELRRISEDSGSTKGALTCEDLKHFRVLLPPADEQNRIVSIAREATAGVEGNLRAVEREISLLREYRTRLIADVVTGKLDVRDAAARLPEDASDTEPPDEADAEVEGEEPAEQLEALAEDAGA